MDEIDAALDFKNVSIVAHYIKVSPPLPVIKISTLLADNIILIHFCYL